LIATGRISKTVPVIFAADETLDVGVDGAAPVTGDYLEGEANKFKLSPSSTKPGTLVSLRRSKDQLNRREEVWQ
jgi:hypothetical protein